VRPRAKRSKTQPALQFLAIIYLANEQGD